MPIYEYKCQQCGIQFEKRQSVSESPLATCEKCHGKLEKQWSLSGFQFKGAGWYVTDYAAKKTGAPAGEKTAAEKTSSGESTASTESASNTTSTTCESKTKETAAASPVKE